MSFRRFPLNSRREKIIQPTTPRRRNSFTLWKSTRQNYRSSSKNQIDWISSLSDDIVLSPAARERQRAACVSPNAHLLFPSPTNPTTRTPRTLRRIIDDCGLTVLKESPLSGRDSFYVNDLHTSDDFLYKKSNIGIKPSPRPMSMRISNNGNGNETGMNNIPMKKVAQSERTRRPGLEFVYKDEKSKSMEEEDEWEKEWNQKDIEKLFDLSEFDFEKIGLNKVDPINDVDLSKLTAEISLPITPPTSPPRTPERSGRKSVRFILPNFD